MSEQAAAVYVNPDSLIPWDSNPRKYQPVDEIAESIKRFGFGAVIVVREQDNRIIAGHTRWMAAKKLGLEQVPVRYMHISMEHANALALADNKLGDLAAWDNDKLNDVLNELASDMDFDLDGLGWSVDEINTLLNGVEEATGFLDHLLDADDDSAHASDQVDSIEPTDGDDAMVNLVVPVTVMERKAVMAAINAAKLHFEVNSTREALVRLCEKFSNEMEQA